MHVHRDLYSKSQTIHSCNFQKYLFLHLFRSKKFCYMEVIKTHSLLQQNLFKKLSCIFFIIYLLFISFQTKNYNNYFVLLIFCL